MNVNNVYPKVDKALDYIPGASTINSIVQLFLKRVYIPRADTNKIQSSNYFSHVKDKSTWRCAVVFIPVLGNLIVAIYDLAKAFSSKKVEQPPAPPVVVQPQPQQPTLLERFQSEPERLTRDELLSVLQQGKSLSVPITAKEFFNQIDPGWRNDYDFMRACRDIDIFSSLEASPAVRGRWQAEAPDYEGL